MEALLPGEREPLHATSPPATPVPASSTTKSMSLPLFLAHPQKLRPATHPISTEEDAEEELLDYGDVEDLEDLAVTSDGGDDAETPDLWLVQESTAPAPGLVATSSSVTPAVESGGSSDVDHHATTVQEGSKAAPKLNSVLVIPDRVPMPASCQRISTADGRWELGVNAMQCAARSPEWQTARRNHWWRKPEAQQSAMTELKQMDAATLKKTGAGRAGTARDAFLKRLAGHCFRCLAFDHRVAQCRDPVRCLSCKGVGHISRSCPSRRHRPIPELQARLQFPPGSIHSRIVFPPLHHQPTAKAPTHAPELHPPAVNPWMENPPRHALSRPLCSSATTVEVADALSVQLQVPRNDIHVTRLRPGEFVVVFQLPPEHVRTCSPPAYRQAGAADMELMDRGRSWSRSPSRTARNRDYLYHASDDWERRRSRSPDIHRKARTTQLQQPPVSHDPLLDMCRTHGDFLYREDDPMVQESLLPLSRAAGQPNYSSNSSEKAHKLLGSMEEASVSDDDNGASASLSHGPGGCDDEGVCGLEVHALQDQTPRQDFNDVADEQEVEELEAAGQAAADFCSKLFKEVPTPLLPTPESPPPRPTQPCARKPRKTPAATRSSLRLAAKPSSVPVAERAQRKLMRELEFINPLPSAPDAAVTAYIDKHGGDLPEEAVKAIRAATRLDNKELVEALAAIVEGSDAVEMLGQ